MVHDNLIKALLESARVILFACVSWLATEGVLGILVDVYLGVLIDPSIKILVAGFLLSIVKAVDKYLHEASNKGTGFLGEKGLSNF